VTASRVLAQHIRVKVTAAHHNDIAVFQDVTIAQPS
jgi:hypothetical protein